MSDKVLQQLADEIVLLKREVTRLKLKEVPSATVWTDWTPTVTQSGTVTFDTTLARYAVIQNTVIARARLGVTGTGTTSNAIIIGGLPFSAATVSGDIGDGRIVDTTGPISYQGACNLQTATSFQVVASGYASGVGLTPAFALANGDVITFVVIYEKA